MFGFVRIEEGELHFLSYAPPKSPTKAEIVRNLMTALKSAGFSIDWESHSGDFTCHLGKVYIRESVNGGGDYQQTIVIEKATEQLVVANAAMLFNGLKANGRMVVNGILFDTGKAELKPESAAALTEVVTRLKQDAALKLFVVGHTDNVGVLTANVELSRARGGGGTPRFMMPLCCKTNVPLRPASVPATRSKAT